ncbi:MAG: hypothetical protein R6U89_02845 [Dehalococcoidia bacterium]
MPPKKRKGRPGKEKTSLAIVVLVTLVLVGLGVFFWMGENGGSEVTTSPDGTVTVTTGFEVERDAWCQQNPDFCASDALIDRVMCWMPSSALMPAARSGSCWAIATMEISWFQLKQKITFLPDLRSVCESTPESVSGYLAGIQQNRKAVDNVLASLMNSIEKDSFSPIEVCRMMQRDIENGEPVLVVMVVGLSKESECDAAHAVTAYGYRESESEVRFLVADSNTARKDNPAEELVFDKPKADWEYEASYAPEWHNLTVGYLKISGLGVPSLP